MNKKNLLKAIPWQTSIDGLRVLDRTESFVCDCDSHRSSFPPNADNAALIVRCVNSHGALLAACKRALKTIQELPPRVNEDRYEPLMQLTAAIAAAEKGQP